MNYFAARQRECDKRWDYTCKRDGVIYPVGYCAGWREPQPGILTPGQIKEWLNEAIPHQDKFHNDGHATAEEARECYKQYLLDFSLHLNCDASVALKCEMCDSLTTKRAKVDSSTWALCDVHRTRENVEALYGPIGEIWST